jgi:hypothetical protein
MIHTCVGINGTKTIVKNNNLIFGRLEGSRNTKRGFWACFSEEYKKRYKFNTNYETEVDEFHHHVENVPYATILYHPSFLPLFHNSHHVFR